MQRFLELLVEIFSWLSIVASPTLIGLILGALFYLKCKNTFIGILGGILIATIGLILGIIWANKMKKKYGATNFMAGINATTELDYTKTQND